MSRTRSILVAALTVIALLGTIGTASAEPAPTQRFVVGYRIVDGEPARLTAQASGVARGAADVVQEYVVGPDGWEVLVTFVLDDGTVALRVPAGELERVYRPQACQGTGLLEIGYVVDGGTGAYAGATGSGTLVERQNTLGRRVRGVCQGPDSGLEPGLVVGHVVVTGTLVVPGT